MDRLCAGLFGRRDDFFWNQIALTRGGGTDQHGLISVANMGSVDVGLGIDRNCLDPHLPRGGEDAAGDFTAIGNQHGPEHP